MTEAKENRLRANVRRALNEFEAALALAMHTGKKDEREHAFASYIQVQSAKRVLWIEDI